MAPTGDEATVTDAGGDDERAAEVAQATPEDGVVCGSCGEVAPPEATWCEACGHELAVEARPACVSCGEREVDPAEGYCLSCGHRQPRERDHLVLVDGSAAAVSDRGRRHHDNEDAAAIGRVSHPDRPDGAETIVLVVCDGVSSTADSADASLGAATVARDALVAGLAGPGGPLRDAEGGHAETADLLTEAVAAAQARAAASIDEGAGGGVLPGAGDGPPSSTLVASVARPRLDGGIDVVTAWVGDSRAYWVTDGEPRRLTGDDHELEGGLIRWLGADSVDPTPDIASVTVAGPGQLVVCSDGLWRYTAEPGELAALVGRLNDEGRFGVDLAEALVGHANDLGGHDNITVALWADGHTNPAAGAEDTDGSTAGAPTGGDT